MKKALLCVSSLALILSSCVSRTYNPGSAALDADNQPAACKGDEFALTGMNKANPPECLDVTSYRALRWFSDDSNYSRIAERFGFATVQSSIQGAGLARTKELYKLAANLKHADEFWVAQIPTNGKATRVVFQVAEFRLKFERALEALNPETRAQLEDLARQNPEFKAELEKLKSGYYTAAHGQLRISYSEPIQLAAHGDPSKKTTLDELVLSVHAVSPGSVPDSYDPIKGLKDYYGTSRGIYSLADKINQAIERHVRVGKEPSLVRQYELAMSPEQADQFVNLYLSGAKPQWENEPYNTITKNCGSELFVILDRILQIPESRYQGAALLGRYYPKYAQFALFANGLLQLRDDAALSATGLFDDTQVARPMPSLNKESNLPEPTP